MCWIAFAFAAWAREVDRVGHVLLPVVVLFCTDPLRPPWYRCGIRDGLHRDVHRLVLEEPAEQVR